MRLIVNESARNGPAKKKLAEIACNLDKVLGPHTYPPEGIILYESDMDLACAGVPAFPLEGVSGVRVIDRLATESNWMAIAPESSGPARIVFFSIKGGVGRSTAMAAAAWALAQEGKRVLVLDLDLESPGLSSALLPEERRPTYGIADWLVEDLVGNAAGVFSDMVATSTLARDGEIFVVPAHGREPGEYVSKLGRAWMCKRGVDGVREAWSQRLNRLITQLEERWKPDVVLIDSRAGIDEVASSCVTDLGAKLVLLFAIDGHQTWAGYRILFRHWRIGGSAELIRERLQVVGAMIPEQGSKEYFAGMRERSHDLFAEELYDEVRPPSKDSIGPDPEDPAKWKVTQFVEGWNFNQLDEGAPHYPLAIKWNSGFATLRSLHDRQESSDRG